MRYPHSHEYTYRQTLLAYVYQLKLALKRHMAPIVPVIVKEVTDHLVLPTGTITRHTRHDAWQDDLRNAMNKIAKDMVDPASRTIKKMHALGPQVNNFNKAEWTKLIRSQYGVNPTNEDPEALKPLMEQWAKNNAALIKDIPVKTMDQIQEATIAALQSGQSTKDMTAKVFNIMSERTDVSDSRAKLIARDQVAKLNGKLTQERQRDIGVEGYIWRTVGDERVRETHQEVDGDYYSWDEPPAETDGNHPGEDYQCRCWAEPSLPEYLEFQASLLDAETEDA